MTNDSFSSADLESDYQSSGPAGSLRSNLQQPETDWFDIGDTLAAVPRGVVGAVQDVANLVPGVDWHENPLGRSSSVSGSIVEGLTNFATGFVPVYGWLGKAGKLGRTLNLTHDAEEAFLDASKIARFEGDFAAETSLARKATATKVARGLAAGAITDFAVFDGHEERLSNLIQSVPALQNPITEFLAANNDDSQVVGRLKAAVEGLGIGAFTEAVILGAKAIKAARLARAAGKAPEEVEAAMDAVAPPKQIEDAFNKGFSQEPVLTREPPETPRVATKQRLTSAIERLQSGEIDHPQFEQEMVALSSDLERQGDVKLARTPSDRQRGAGIWRERLERAARVEDLSPDTVDFAKWLINEHPQVVDDLGISIRSRKADFAGAAGAYNPQARVAVLFKESANTGTAVHEILHHTERMMPDSVQKGIREEWVKNVLSELKDAQKSGNTIRADALNDALKAGYGSAEAERSVQQAFRNGILTYDDYHLANPSEFWAVRGTELLRKRYGAEVAGLGWLNKAYEWLTRLGEKAKEFLGLKSDNAVLTGLDEVLNGTGRVQNGKMLAAARSFNDLGGAAGGAADEFAAGADKRGYILRNLGFDEEKIKAINEERTARETQNATIGATDRVNPRNLDPISRARQSLRPEDINLAHFTGPEGRLSLIRTVQDYFRNEIRADISPLERKSLIMQASEAESRVKDALGLPTERAAQLRLVAGLADDLRTAEEIAVRAHAADFVLQTYAAHNGNLLKELELIGSGAKAGNYDAHLIKVYENLQFMSEVEGAVLGFRAHYGRALGGYRMRVNVLDFPEGLQELTHDPASVQKQLDSLGGRERLTALARKAQIAFGQGGEEGTTKLWKVQRGSLGQRTLDMTLEYWMNAILSGPKTFVVNALGPTLFSIYKPIETMVGASFDVGASTLNGNAAQRLMAQKTIRTAVRQVMELAHGHTEAWNAAKAVAQGGDVLGNQGLLDSFTRKAAITASNAGLDPNSIAGQATDWFGRVVRVPTTLLQSTDEYIKQINYRAYARAELYEELLSKGTPAEQIPGLVHEQMEKLIFENQAYSARQVYRRGLAQATSEGITDPALKEARATEFVKAEKASGDFDRLNALSQKAVANAQDVTFTTPAAVGSFSRNLQNFVGQHPYLRLVVPFINTPLNILSQTGQRLDVVGATRFANGRIQNLLGKTTFPEFAESLEGTRSHLLADMVSGDARRSAEAQGRIAAGFGIGTFLLSRVASGDITGRGPSDPEQRRILMDSGWQPYSVKVGDGFYSYARMDPFATLIGTMADIGESARWAHDEDQPALERLVNGLAISAANNFTNKSYLTGVSNFVEMLQDPTRKAQLFFQRFAGSFVPSIAGQAVLASGDDNERDVRSILDAMVNKLPGLSEKLPPQRNVLGEPIQRVQSASTAQARWTDWFNPIAYREVSDDVVRQEMAGLGHAFTPPKRVRNGLDLSDFKAGTTTAYDRYNELRGAVNLGGLGLRDALRREIMSGSYQKLSPLSSYSEGTLEFESPRVARLRSIINRYDQRAYQQLLHEVPDLNLHEREFMRQKRALKAGLSIIPTGSNQ